MNLFAHLVLRLAGVVLLCMVCAIGWVLYDSHRSIEKETAASAGRVAKALEALYWKELLWRGGLSREHIVPMPTAIHLYVPDVDQAYERALKAGAKSLMPVSDQPYGERSGGVEDVHGNRWYIATPFVPLETIAKNLHTVTVYFHPIGAQGFIDFVTKAFGGKELMRHAEGDMILHAKVQIGDSVIELGEARYPTQPLPTAIYLYVDDVDAMYEQALKAGGISMLAPADQPYGDRSAWVKDPFDNVWYLAAPARH